MGDIARNAASLVAGRVLAKAVWVVVTFQVARHLGKGPLGAYAYAMAYVVFFEALATLGLHFLLQRECASRPAEAPALLGRALALWTRVAVFCPVLIVLPSWLLRDPAETTKGIAAASIGLLFWSLGSIYNAALVAQERMGRVAAIDGGTSVVRAALCLGAILLDGSVVSFLACYTLAHVVFYVASWASCPVRPVRPPAADLRPLFRAALPFALMILASGVYFRADVVILMRLRSDIETGIYEAAWRPVNEVMTLGQLVAMSFLPRLAALFASDVEGYRRTARTALRTMLLLGVPAATIGSVFAVPLVRVCYGAEYAASADVFRIVALGVAAYFPACALTYAIVASGRTWFWTALLGGKATVSIVLHLLLVPRYGAVGTGTAMLVSDLLAAAACAVAWLAYAPRVSRG